MLYPKTIKLISNVILGGEIAFESLIIYHSIVLKPTFSNFIFRITSAFLNCGISYLELWYLEKIYETKKIYILPAILFYVALDCSKIKFNITKKLSNWVGVDDNLPEIMTKLFHFSVGD